MLPCRGPGDACQGAGHGEPRGSIPLPCTTTFRPHHEAQRQAVPCCLRACTHALDCLQVQRKLLAACILCFIFMIIEVVGGYLAKRCAAVSHMQQRLPEALGR